MLSEHRDNRVHTYFRRFLQKPVVPGTVLRRADSHLKTIRMSSEFIGIGFNHSFRLLGISYGKTALVKPASTVNYIDAVTFPMAKHLHAMCRFLRVKSHDTSLDIP